MAKAQIVLTRDYTEATIYSEGGKMHLRITDVNTGAEVFYTVLEYGVWVDLGDESTGQRQVDLIDIVEVYKQGA